MNSIQLEWLQNTIIQAKESNHIFPEMAGCEAALESGYGTSTLAREANNLFGSKQCVHPLFGTLTLPTKEFLNDQWVEVDANWVNYPDIASCFTDRMTTLTRLAPNYPHYAAALNAPDVTTFISEVSKSWSTDPERAINCQRIYNTYKANSLPPIADLSHIEGE